MLSLFLFSGTGEWQLAAQTAAEMAARQEATEQYQRLQAKVEESLEAQSLIHKRLSALADELRALQQELDRKGGDFATRDELRKLADAVREVDKRREDDRREILEAIRKLASQPAPAPPPARVVKEKSTEPEPAATPATPQKGYEYEVLGGDTLSAIAAAYRANGIPVTPDQILKANPGLVASRLIPGRKIFIPDPKAK